jgi:hypothetical protein
MSPYVARRRANIALTISMVVAAVSFSTSFFLWAIYTSSNQNTLCKVIYATIAKSGATVGKPGTPGYAYYQEHPEELRVARAQNEELLGTLPCKSKIPSTGGKK